MGNPDDTKEEEHLTLYKDNVHKETHDNRNNFFLNALTWKPLNDLTFPHLFVIETANA